MKRDINSGTSAFAGQHFGCRDTHLHDKGDCGLQEGHLRGPTRVDMLAVIPVGLCMNCSVHACGDLIF